MSYETPVKGSPSYTCIPRGNCGLHASISPAWIA